MNAISAINIERNKYATCTIRIVRDRSNFRPYTMKGLSPLKKVKRIEAI